MLHTNISWGSANNQARKYVLSQGVRVPHPLNEAILAFVIRQTNVQVVNAIVLWVF